MASGQLIGLHHGIMVIEDANVTYLTGLNVLTVAYNSNTK